MLLSVPAIVRSGLRGGLIPTQAGLLSFSRSTTRKELPASKAAVSGLVCAVEISPRGAALKKTCSTRVPPQGKRVSWGLRACAGTCGAPIGALPRAEGGLWTPEARLAAARASPCAPNDGLPVGRVTRTLAHTADHEKNKRCGRHIWLQWTMMEGGEARPPSAHVWDRSPGFSAALRPTLQPA